MEALIKTVRDLFTAMHRYTVPAYQRPYVWTEDRQWQPLWEDVERVADARLDQGEDHHFLGAIVIRRESTPPGGITEWSVIDGQQRLTTLQLLISGMSCAARDDGFESEARKLAKLIHHDQDDAVGDGRFKFWPTSVNREAFRQVAAIDGAPTDFEDDPRNNIHEAWLFFRARAYDYAHAEAVEGEDVGLRYAALREAVTGLLQLVTISLDRDDPAQVIFETLNARGTPLLALDLVKNSLFDAAEKHGIQIEPVYEQFWDELADLDYWAEEERLGRITVPRSEIFLMHWLAMMLGEVISSERLFELFRGRILAGTGSDDPVELIRTLNADAKLLRGFDAYPPGGFEHRFFETLKRLDTTTIHPVALLLFRSELSPEGRQRALEAIESYLVRRMICGLSAKNYSQLAARLVSRARLNLSRADELIVDELLGSQSDTYRWPTDDEIRNHLISQPLYGWLGQKRIVMLLSALELFERRGKTEAIQELPPKLEIEHLMPQSWRRHWPLDDPTDDEAERSRDARINLLGNLTLVAQPLNASMSNSPWELKRRALDENSLLFLNKELRSHSDAWNEVAIDARTRRLADLIVVRWPGPHVFMPEGWRPREAESWPEQAEMEIGDLRAVHESGSNYLRALLNNLATHAGQRRAFREVEESLEWPRGRLSSVCGGYGSKTGPQYGGLRPWHIHLDEDGQWWMWMDKARAEAMEGTGDETS